MQHAIVVAGQPVAFHLSDRGPAAQGNVRALAGVKLLLFGRCGGGLDSVTRSWQMQVH